MWDAQCAWDSGGNLKDASEIEFYNSESDDKPIPAASSATRRSTRKRQTDKLTKSLAAEHAGEDGNPQLKRAPAAPHAGAPRAPRTKRVPETWSEEEDDDFDSDMPALEDVSDSDASDSEGEPLDNNEIADLLFSKTVPVCSGASSKPQTRRKSGVVKRKRNPEVTAAPPPTKSRKATVEEVEDEDDLPKTIQFKNTIYLFYDVIAKNSEGSAGKRGDKHYKCRHGNGRIITVTKAMRYNVSGLTTHLRKDFPVMYRLYQALYTRRDEPPTQQEIELAHGDVPIDGEAPKLYLGKVELATANIIKSLETQAKKSRGDFSQEVFNTLLAEYIVACDQPFDTVEKPEFIRLMEYTHHGSSLNFNIPGRMAIKNRIMKMGEVTVASTRQMFQSARKKAKGKSASYQDTVTASVLREDDDNWEDDDEEEEEDDTEPEPDNTGNGNEKLKSVAKLRKIIRSIRGSPQRHQEWVREVETSAAFKAVSGDVKKFGTHKHHGKKSGKCAINASHRGAYESAKILGIHQIDIAQ
ncbi:hypothetical protein B0H10DRAFT_1962360 [Mycena sp. CBHHK59/15]|nr:hypothetical protein B0H10DRAFT_1962360 [Mycena sp. CBHHK59/15]